MENKKSKEIKIRCTETLLRKLMAICAVKGKTKTAIIEDLILQEYKKKQRYEEKYYEEFYKTANEDGNVQPL